MNVLDIFSGIGGFSLGLERAGMHTVAFCEIDPFCQAILRKHWSDAPIHGDVRALCGLPMQRCRSNGHGMTVMKKYKRKVLTLKDALDLMRLGRPLMVMHDQGMANGRGYFIVPGGSVDDRNAQKIIERDDVMPFDNGLFPGCAQSWKMGA